MYCSECGSQIKSELNYCNRCGARVGRMEKEDRSLSTGLSNSLGAIGVFGLIGFIFVVMVLVKNGVTGNSLAAISFFYLATLFGICVMILQQLKMLPKKSTRQDFQNNFQPPRLDAANTAQLEESKQTPISSVTEHTTRTLDEVLIERK